MKTIKFIISLTLLLVFATACNDDFGETDFINSDVAPTNVSAVFSVTQDNTGLVSITPTATGVTFYKIYFGDNTQEPVEVKLGEAVKHTYTEGNYEVRIIAVSATGKETETKLPLEVSFKAPENLEVLIENDKAVSKKVNMTVKADYAVSYDVYFGEDETATPTTANIGESVSHIYAEAGTYTVTVEVRGAAIQTTKYEKVIEVEVLQQPTTSAPTPPLRETTDVVSVFSNAYTNLEGVNYNPDWGQGGQGSSFAMFNLKGDDMLNFINLSYQGIQFTEAVDLSAMEYLHIDIWTANAEKIETSLISVTNGENLVVNDLLADGWTSIDIPLTAFTEQGLKIADIHQLKFVGTPWATGTVFVDNIYFYKKSSGGLPPHMIQNFEGEAPAFTAFGGVAVEVVDNPDVSENNSTQKVAKMIKTNGAETWAGAFFEVPVIDLNNYSNIAMKVWSPKQGAVVKMKLENSDASIVHEVDMNTTSANTWEELTYDFSSAPQADYVKVVVFFDFGNTGDDMTYYYDEIQLVSGEAGEPAILFEGFEGQAPTFTAFGGIEAEVVANPDATGENTTTKVVKMLKTNGAETWAGALFEKAIDVVTYKKIAIKTYSPKKDIVVKMKLENADGSIVHEVDMSTTSANTWEELTYDFSSAPQADYVKVVVFFDFGNTGDDSVYYYDEISLMK